MQKHDLIHEFPEYSDAISRLKNPDHHFQKLMEDWFVLNGSIENDEATGRFGDDHLEEQKKKRLHLKDEIAGYLSQHP